MSLALIIYCSFLYSLPTWGVRGRGTTAESGLTAATHGGHSCHHSAAQCRCPDTMAMYWQHRIVKFDMKKE